ncbi:tyrosine-type recombinase/integrase, partial [Mycobacterium kansasii]
LTSKQVRTSITGRTKKDIKVKLSRLQNDFIKNGCTKKLKVLKTFNDVAASWFDFYKINRKPATIKQTEKNLRLYLLPAFGNYKIDKLTTA